MKCAERKHKRFVVTVDMYRILGHVSRERTHRHRDTALGGLCTRRYEVCSRCALLGECIDVFGLNPPRGITMCLESGSIKVIQRGVV